MDVKKLKLVFIKCLPHEEDSSVFRTFALAGNLATIDQGSITFDQSFDLPVARGKEVIKHGSVVYDDQSGQIIFAHSGKPAVDQPEMIKATFKQMGLMFISARYWRIGKHMTMDEIATIPDLKVTPIPGSEFDLKTKAIPLDAMLPAPFSFPVSFPVSARVINKAVHISSPNPTAGKLSVYREEKDNSWKSLLMRSSIGDAPFKELSQFVEPPKGVPGFVYTHHLVASPVTQQDYRYDLYSIHNNTLANFDDQHSLWQHRWIRHNNAFDKCFGTVVTSTRNRKVNEHKLYIFRRTWSDNDNRSHVNMSRINLRDDGSVVDNTGDVWVDNVRLPLNDRQYDVQPIALSFANKVLLLVAGKEAAHGIVADVAEDGTLPTAEKDWRWVNINYNVGRDMTDGYVAGALAMDESFVNN
ncbi:hypothetical protein HDV63DRAFT_384332 [Trichoderma sp. SZMC 28014]